MQTVKNHHKQDATECHQAATTGSGGQYIMGSPPCAGFYFDCQKRGNLTTPASQ